jgi:fimbrial chaperone protein
MSRIITAAFAAACAAATPLAASAAALQVSPVLLQVRAPGSTTSMTLRNEGARPLTAQARVFRWTQVDGKDVLEPTNLVVASPPIVNLASRVDYAVRVVRTNRQAVAREEAYRLLVDEVPDESRRVQGTITLAVRHSIPIFFMPEDAAAPRLSWSVRNEGGRVTVTARNEGGRRVRISRLKVSDGTTMVSFGEGLIGYALAGSSMSWTRTAPRPLGGSVTVTAQGDTGAISAKASVAARR